MREEKLAGASSLKRSQRRDIVFSITLLTQNYSLSKHIQYLNYNVVHLHFYTDNKIMKKQTLNMIKDPLKVLVLNK